MKADLIKRTIWYIEEAAYDIESEWGKFRTLKKLISDGDMPKVYYELIEELKLIDSKD